MLSWTALSLVASIILLVYFYQKRKLTYWKRKGIPQLNPILFFGNVLKVFTLSKFPGELYQEFYEKTKNLKYIGFYQLTRPTLLVNDLTLVENILVKDFRAFVNRGLPQANHKSDVDYGLPQLQDTLWRGLRYKMSPVFSSGKLKLMFENMKPCSQKLLSHLESIRNTDVDLKDVTTRFTIDVIGSCAFGLDITKDTDTNSQFRQMGAKIISSSLTGYYLQLLLILDPKLAEKFGVMLSPKDASEYFSKVIKDTFQIRKDSKFKRNDLVDFLLQIKEQGVITVHNKDPDDKYLEIENVAPTESFAITDPMLISQAFTFFSAGFDGLSSPAVCIIHSLAIHKQYQQRCRDEIQMQIEKHGSLNYEALRSMNFLDSCISEGLRIYPLSPFILREANRDYELENGVWIEAGTQVLISTAGFQMDPNYYPDPHTFNPDRNSSKISANVSDFTNLPFGAGPRMCIGMRMAQIIMKLLIASIIYNYDVSLSPKCPKQIKYRTTVLANVIKEATYTYNMKKLT